MLRCSLQKPPRDAPCIPIYFSRRVISGPPESNWVPLLIPLERLDPEPQGGYQRSQFIYIEARAPKPQGTLQSKSPTVIDIKDYVIYSAPEISPFQKLKCAQVTAGLLKSAVGQTSSVKLIKLHHLADH